MKIHPLYDRVVVKRNKEDKTSSGGIILTSASKEKPNQGEVIAIGNGKILDNGDVRPLSVAVGDTVIFGRYADNNTIEEGDDEYIILNENDIYGIIEN